MRYFKAKKGLFQLRYIYGKLRYPVHFVLTGFFCKLFIYKYLKGFFGVLYVHFIMLLLYTNLFYLIIEVQPAALFLLLAAVCTKKVLIYPLRQAFAVRVVTIPLVFITFGTIYFTSQCIVDV